MTAPGRDAPPVLSASAQKVQDAITAAGFANRVIELAAPVRTAAEAAVAVGCEVGQIAKSIVFMAARTRRPILVVASGAHRVSESAIEALIGEPLARATPEFVREHTGFAIGGTPPLGHARPIETFLDRDLLALDVLWAAAGHPNSLFQVTPDELSRMTRGRVVSVA